MVKNVYVVSTGERSEGHSPHAVYHTFKSAVKRVKAIAGVGELIPLAGECWKAKQNDVDEVWIEKFRLL